MRPTRVDMPVATTIARALPLVTVQLLNAIFSGVSFSPSSWPPPPLFSFSVSLLLPLASALAEPEVFVKVPPVPPVPPPLVFLLLLCFPDLVPFFIRANLATSSGSPVRSISLTLRSSLEKRRTSAGQMSPTARRTISPRTMVVLDILCSSPSRMTRALGWASLESASSAPAAEFSVNAPMEALMMTMTKIAMPSISVKVSQR